MHDAHCHFFSSAFFETLTRGRADLPVAGRADAVCRHLGWDAPGTPEDLADRWVAELDANGVRRAALIASVPGDEDSVATAVNRHPHRFVGFAMIDATAPDAVERTTRALDAGRVRCICLFPAMHGYSLDSEAAVRVVETVAQRPGCAVFVHCGALTVGVRKRLGLRSPFDIRRGDPLAVNMLAARHPNTPFIIPHFGAGFFRETLMAADLAPNVYLDTSSSNGWINYHAGLTLDDVFRQSLAVAGPERLLFGTDSSYFPRGWQRTIYDAQCEALARIGVAGEVQDQIFHRTFDGLFPVPL